MRPALALRCCCDPILPIRKSRGWELWAGGSAATAAFRMYHSLRWPTHQCLRAKGSQSRGAQAWRPGESAVSCAAAFAFVAVAAAAQVLAQRPPQKVSLVPGVWALYSRKNFNSPHYFSSAPSPLFLFPSSSSSLPQYLFSSAWKNRISVVHLEPLDQLIHALEGLPPERKALRIHRDELFKMF